MPFLARFGVAWVDAMVARWSANPLAMLWPEMEVAVAAAGGAAAARRPVIIIAAS